MSTYAFHVASTSRLSSQYEFLLSKRLASFDKMADQVKRIGLTVLYDPSSEKPGTEDETWSDTSKDPRPVAE
jgi:hypothetical protein